MSRHSAQCTNRQNSTLAGLGGTPGVPELWRLRQEDSETMGKPRLVIDMRNITQSRKVDEPQDFVEWQTDHRLLTQKRPQGAKAGTVARWPGTEGNEVHF